MREDGRKKVVILGGGIGALTVAFELTSRPDWKEQFSEISVYQQGWRLGGKAASGRNAQAGSRLEEAATHIWPGFYDRAFRLVQQCYEELGREPGQPLARWQDAFQPHDGVVLYDETDGQPRPWSLAAPRNDTLPGSEAPPPSPWELVARCTQLVRTWWTEFSQRTAQRMPKEREAQRAWADQWVNYAVEFTRHLDGAVRYTGKAEALQHATLDILDQTQQTLTGYAQPLLDWDDRERRLWGQQDLCLTAMRGALRDDVPHKGFDPLDEADFRQWLQRHGASPLTLKSPLVRGLYDALFAYAGGDRRSPGLAAGVALRFLCRMTFQYKGALLWTLPAGVGDGVIAPLYQVLRRRGVQFHFFHRVQSVKLSDDKSSIAEIHLDRQATSKQGYEPLIDVKGLPCWPATPRYELLDQGPELQKRGVDLESPWTDWGPVERRQLFADKDFDAVVLGIPPAALAHCGPDLIEAATKWRKLRKHAPSVATAVSQLWFNRTQGELGWDFASPLVTTFKPPLDTCADITPTLAWERWDLPTPPQSVASLRGVLSDLDKPPTPGPSEYPERQLERVRQAALEWFTQQGAPLWPRLYGPERQVQWEVLVDPLDRRSEDRFGAQYHRALVNPTDRYVQSAAGTTQVRLSPGQAWFGNLFICGDWTRTALNAGCIEAAVMSGLVAAAALRGEEPPTELAGDWPEVESTRSASDHLAP